MMNWKRFKLYQLGLLAVFGLACSQVEPSDSDLSVTRVEHSDVKQQSIGNCWLYAKASWLESKLLETYGKQYDVSETYWTFWHFYEELVGNPAVMTELQTGGYWDISTDIIQRYGWVEEHEFVPEEKTRIMSKSQECAEEYVNEQLAPGGRLHNPVDRSAENVKQVLTDAFSCNGLYEIDVDAARAKSRSASTTMLKDPRVKQTRSLSRFLREWNEVYNEASFISRNRRDPEAELARYYRNLEQRIKRALNDNQPVVLSFFVSFNAVDENGMFNLESLEKAGDLGSSGGHMVVLHDYTVDNVPGIGRLGEGDMSAELKNLALQGDLDYLVSKNSWGANRTDRPWLGDGYSRISWDYLKATYVDKESQSTRQFLQSIIFPPGY